MKIHRLLFLLTLCWALGACNKASDPHGHDHSGEEAHGHSHGPPAVSKTVWTEKFELFVECPQLVVGEKSTFAAHFSDMRDFGAVEKGEVTVSLIKGKNGIRHKVDRPSSPGIFRPALQPKEAGIHRLIFDIQTPEFSDRIAFDSVVVYSDADAASSANPEPEADPNTIAFLKEQAWKIDFANAAAKRDTIFEIIPCGGEIIAARGNEVTVSATAPGILVYKKRNANIGAAVASGEVLFSIAGSGIVDQDLESRFKKASSALAQAKAEYERKTKLFEIKAIAKSELEKAKLAFDIATAEYESLSSNYGRGGKTVKASEGGFLKKLYHEEGDFVEAGEPLAIIAENKTVTLRADVGAEAYDRLNKIRTANFISGDKTYSIDELDGKLLSYGRSISRDRPKVPVYFELANRVDLLPGSFVEVFLQLQPGSQALVIPTSALLEEYGNYSVIVQTGGESFEQRQVKIGVSNGREVEVLSGLAEGERVVTRGAYQIKMAALSGTVPSHGHAH